MQTEERNYYKYHFKIGNFVVHGGITNNLEIREQQHRDSGKYITVNGKRIYWKDGHIVQVGSKVTKESALAWERENGYGANQD